MLALRTSGRSVGRKLRPGHTLWLQSDDAPHAESSSRPHLARRSQSTATASESTVVPRSLKGTDIASPAGKRKRQAMSRARLFAEALQRKDGPLSGARTAPDAEAQTTAPQLDPARDAARADSEAKIANTLAEVEKIIVDEEIRLDALFGRLKRQRTDEEITEVYKISYKKIFERIGNAFLAPQLRAALKEVLGSAVRKMSKPMLVQHTMADQGWEVPQAHKADEPVELSKLVLDLPDHELFLFLRATRFVSDLVLNKGVSFSVVADPNAPDSGRSVLCANAQQHWLDDLSKALAARKVHMTQIRVDEADIYSFTPSAGMIQYISNVTETYIEPWESNTYRISSMSPARAEWARLLLHVAALRSVNISPSRGLATVFPTPLMLQDPVTEYFPDTNPLYSLLPYFASASSVLPWESASPNEAAMLYRMRRVTSWSPRPGKRESKHRTEAVQGAVVQVVKGEGQDAENVVLSDLVGRLRAGEEGSQQVVTVKFGHLLLPPNRNSSPLHSPIRGQWPSVDTRSQLASVESRPIFSPCVTPRMLHNPLKNPARRERRVTYRSLDNKTAVTFTHTKQRAVAEAAPVEVKRDEPIDWLAQLDKMVEEMEAEDRLKEQRMLEKANADQDQDDDSDLTGHEDPARTSGPDSESNSSTAPTAEHVDDVAGIREGVSSPVEDAATVQASTSEDDGGDGPTQHAPDSEPDNEASSMSAVEIVAERSSLEELDVFLPDRPVDARLQVRSTSALDSTSIPDSINTFFTSALAPPPPKSSVNDQQPSNKPRPRAPLSVSITSGNSEVQTLFLESDEECEIVESFAREGDVLLRSVKSKDMVLGIDRVSSHSELVLVGNKVPDHFWREWASVSRDMNPELSANSSMKL